MVDFTLADTEALPRLGVRERPPMRARLLHIGRRYPQLVIGSTIVLLFVVIGLLAPIIAPHGIDDQNLLGRLAPPLWSGGTPQYPLGTDEFGRDVFSRLIYGARVSLVVGFFSVIISGAFGTFVGLVSGYVGGNLDAFMMRLVDVQLSFPYILIAIVISAFWGAGFLTVVIALSLAGWMGFARTMRSLILGIKNAQYAEAARALGANDTRIMIHHLLPNALPPLLVYTTFQVPARILAEATLSFLGLGIQPPAPSWGNMLAENREYITTHPWLVILPGICLSIVALGTNMFGDGLRDLLDPRTRRKQ